jgi:endonuclease-3
MKPRSTLLKEPGLPIKPGLPLSTVLITWINDDMNKEKRIEIFRRLRAADPSPTTELAFSSNFELLISVILSAQATDISVNKATQKLYEVANTPEAMLTLGVNGLKKYVRTIGLFNTKSANIIKTCAMLVEKHHSTVPDNREDLEALPGVGRKTANVILNTAFRQPTMAVDTHIFRVSNRTAIAPGKNVLEVEKRLLRLVPEEFLLDAHHWLILHGRYVCLARKPRHGACLIEDLCEYKHKVED